ncbi:MAG: SymE family type I addiction module toxin [Pseudomonadales bacterium]
MKNRTLKVRWTRYDHPIKGKDAYYLPPPVPFVLLKGYWLEDHNFQIGHVVNVEVQEDKLILTTAPS